MGTEELRRTTPLSILLTALIALTALTAGPAAASLLGTGDGTQNTTPPPDDPGWDLLGTSNWTHVYLGGPGGVPWVMTANHVGVLPVTFGGVTYAPIPATKVRLDTPGATYDADVILYQIDGDPGLVPPVLATTAPAFGEEMVLIGYGRNRDPDLTHWNASWNEVPGGGVHHGYHYGVGNTMRWGTNLVSDVSAVLPDGEFTGIGGTTAVFGMVFDQSGLPEEAIGAKGDSGGAVFVKRAGSWELAGMTIAALPFQDQPENTAVFGNIALAADLSVYAPEIDAVLLPEPASAPGLPAGALLLAALARRRPRRA